MVAKEAALLGRGKTFLFWEELDGSLDLGSWILVAERCLLSHGSELAWLVPLTFSSHSSLYVQIERGELVYVLLWWSL